MLYPTLPSLQKLVSCSKFLGEPQFLTLVLDHFHHSQCVASPLTQGLFQADSSFNVWLLPLSSLFLLHTDSAPPHHSWNWLLLPLCTPNTPCLWYGRIIPCLHLSSSKVATDWFLCPQEGMYPVVQIRHAKNIVIYRIIKESLAQPRVKEGFSECVLCLLWVEWGLSVEE